MDSRQPLRDRPDLPNDLAAGRGYLGFVRNGWPETLGVDMLTGRPEQVVRLPRPSHLPLYTALATALFFLSVLFAVYTLALAALAGVAVLALLWTRTTGEPRDHGPLPIGGAEEITLPLHTEHPAPPSRTALSFLLLADLALFGSLVFGCIYLAFVAPAWPPPVVHMPSLWVALAAALALLAALSGALWALRAAIAGGGHARRAPGLLLAAVMQALACALFALLLARAPDPVGHAHAAATAALAWYAILHSAIGVLFAGFGWHRSRLSLVSPRRAGDLRLVAVWQAYATGIGIAVLALLFAMAGTLT